MLRFELDTENAGLWIDVCTKNSDWLGSITQSAATNFKIVFVASSYHCYFETDVLIAIADKLDELNAELFKEMSEPMVTQC